MNNATLPASDMKQLRNEVGARSPEAALPCNLSDFWLEMIARDLEELAAGHPVEINDSSSFAAAPMAIILQIYAGKLKVLQTVLSIDDLDKHFEDLRAEIKMEIVSRRTGAKYEPATLEDIFTERTPGINLE